MAKKGDKTIPYGTVKLLHVAGEMIKHCEKSERVLSELLPLLEQDTLMSDKQRGNVQRSCVKLRNAHQFSIKMFKEVQELWQKSSSNTTKGRGKRRSKATDSSEGNA